MSIDYSIHVDLFAEYNQKNIRQLLQQASKLGFLFLDHIPGVRYEDSPGLTVDQTTERAMYYYANQDGYLEGLFVHYYDKIYQETYLYFYIRKEKETNKIMFTFSPCQADWKKTHINSDFHAIDLGYCIQLVLEIVQNYCIKSLEVIKI